MTESDGIEGFRASTHAPGDFAREKRIAASERGVRKSGRVPDGRTDGAGPPCWHHDDRFACVALANKLERDRETRRLTSIGIDLAVWMHARSAVRMDTQREFLARYGADWNGTAPPPMGLARGAALYHLPDGERKTLAERFIEGSALFPRLCAAERAWLREQRRARLSFFRVMRVRRGWVRLRDWLGALSGRGDVTVCAGEIPPGDLAEGHTVFARLVRYRGRNYVDLFQARSSVRECVADPGAAPRAMWRHGERLRDRGVMVQTLFATWQRET